MGEQLFLERLEKSGRQGLACAVLFDCGLSQLGSPRLAQLALLILLARRAETARARFSWGVLQDPSFQFTEGVDASAVRHFLRSRSFDAASVAQYDAWTRAAGGWDRFDEVWLIGSPFAHDLPRALRRVEIADVLDPFRRSLEVRLGPRQISLELPGPDQVLGRILRDPFDGSSPSGPPDEFASNILLDHRAARALIRKAPREVHAVTKQTPHSRKAWTTGFDLVFAAGRIYKHYCLAGRLNGELMLHWTRSSAPMPAGPYRVEDAEFALPGPDDRLLPCYPVEAGGNLSVLLLDRHRSLFRLENTGGGPRARHIAEHVLATERFGDSTVVILGRVPGSEHFSLFSFSGAGHIRRLGIGEAVSAFFGSPTQAPFADVVWSPAGGPWRMLNESARTFELEEGSQAVGLVTYPRGDPQMIVLSPDRLSLSLTGRQAALETFPLPIASVSFAAGPGVAACATVDGSIHFVQARR